MIPGKTKMYHLLKNMRIRQKHLCNVLGFHHTTLSRILNGEKEPTVHEAKLLCHFFDRTEEELFSRQET